MKSDIENFMWWFQTEDGGRVGWKYTWANILWLTDTFAYLFVFPGEYYKETIIFYWIELLPFVGLKESIIGNFQKI